MPRTPKPANGAADAATPKRPVAKKTNGNGNGHATLTSDEVARKAYEIYQSRGGSHGADFDDWLEAERQLAVGSGLKTKGSGKAGKGRSAQG